MLKFLPGIMIIVGLSACGGISGVDWRDEAGAKAMQAIRDELGSTAVQFSDVRVVGDSSTGQTCGKVLGDGISSAKALPARFIVYIDGTAGPWIENGHGSHVISDEFFDSAWENDCVKEGW